MSEIIPYTLKRYRRSKYMRIIIHPDGSVVVTSPMRVSKAEIEKFVAEKQTWIKNNLANKNFIKPVDKHKTKLDKADYLKNKAEAQRVIKARVEYYNNFYKFSYNKIFIKNQKTCWGSCSSKDNLNFNYRLLFLTPEQRDYVVVHELCHLAELNHSPRFWRLVEKTIPNYNYINKQLNKITNFSLD